MTNKHESQAGNHPMGSQYGLKLSTRVIGQIETDLNKPFGEVSQDLERGSVLSIVSVLHRGTIPVVERSEIEDALDDHGLVAFQSVIGDAIDRCGLFKGAAEVDADSVGKSS